MAFIFSHQSNANYHTLHFAGPFEVSFFFLWESGGISNMKLLNTLSFMPRAFDTVDCGLEINDDEVNISQSVLETICSLCSKIIEDLAKCVIEVNEVEVPKDPSSRGKNSKRRHQKQFMKMSN